MTMLKRVVLKMVSVLALAVIFYLLLNLPAFITQLRPLEANQSFLPTVTSGAPTLSEGLHIPRLGLEVPIHYEVDATDESKLLKDLQSGITQLLGTARPGERGNVVIVGHSSNYPWEPGKYKTVFAPLDRLQADDYIQIRRQETIYVYQVSGHKVVSPADLSVLAQSNTPQLTLITCTPIGTTLRRLVITATQISPDPTAAVPFTGRPLVGSVPGPR
ncbi:sortase [Candidatus Berkelbacteria bacterium]|nr:sortase [Candidatus Berkelbacteria bacterium]